MVLRWYDENAKKTPAERKAADVNYEEELTRRAAIEWLGRSSIALA